MKKKEEKIHELEEMLQELSEQIGYLEGNDEDYEDTKSEKSKMSKIIKPLKGGAFLFRWVMLYLLFTGLIMDFVKVGLFCRL